MVELGKVLAAMVELETTLLLRDTRAGVVFSNSLPFVLVDVFVFTFLFGVIVCWRVFELLELTITVVVGRGVTVAFVYGLIGVSVEDI